MNKESGQERMRAVWEGDCIDCVVEKPEDLLIAWNSGCQLWQLYIYIYAEYCDESCQVPS